MINKSSSGFTLIELVVVIVILGILSVTAAPRFLSLSSEANAAAIRGVYGAFNSAAELAHSKSIIDGNESKATSTISIGGQSVNMVYGYPNAFNGIAAATELGDVAGYGKNSNNSEHDWVIHYWNWSLDGGGTAPAILLSAGSVTGDAPATAPRDTKCYVRYVQATQTTTPEIFVDTSGC
ncbi:type II secretion system protein [Vibrio sp. SCSIO 43137]|uniref:type II secretion system protein n=1 Tax=Vibrio sp. SCSIO 43137 TaxID=3021011 RepID=UPI002307ADE9|nr:type II secretion system protein [Vibrio sp. SCSIO 43137]WCE30737.1 type II secretion system protein [Vibrio sp. SCSIO 43137]